MEIDQEAVIDCIFQQVDVIIHLLMTISVEEVHLDARHTHLIQFLILVDPALLSVEYIKGAGCSLTIPAGG